MVLKEGMSENGFCLESITYTPYANIRDGWKPQNRNFRKVCINVVKLKEGRTALAFGMSPVPLCPRRRAIKVETALRKIVNDANDTIYVHSVKSFSPTFSGACPLKMIKHQSLVVCFVLMLREPQTSV